MNYFTYSTASTLKTRLVVIPKIGYQCKTTDSQLFIGENRYCSTRATTLAIQKLM